MMRFGLLALTVAAALSAASPLAAQEYSADTSALAGKWTYRSFHNDPKLVGASADKALALIFAEAVFAFTLPTPTTLKGTIDWEGGGLDLEGTVGPGSDGFGPRVAIAGHGRPGTSTDGWEYDYYGEIAHHWPDGVDQVPAIVGTVVRAKPHNGAPAGYVASFVAVRQP